ncbi:sulfatase family protein [Halopiger goleimassiliensis]|uniref:sulfatase family protein n=1 Tax=Halopiger goleimassiliensis TaxID=1293048 RepID=UPI0006780462|nr:sulfatase [Halopiger goleimassiliensis]
MPPSIVLIHTHDLGTYLGCYGAAVETPRIDDLAADGVRFDRHFVTAPQCSPSRSSLVTGRHPHQNGLLGLAHENWEISEDERFLPDLLGEVGYETHLFGLQHVTEYPDRLGYDRIHTDQPLTAERDPAVHETSRARAVADEFERVVTEEGLGDPFFASVGFFELHRVEENGGFGFDGERYDAPDPESVEPLEFLPDRPGIRSDIAGMQGMLHAIDDAVGTVRDALAAVDRADDTLVVFTTEHGLAMPRAKGTCFDPGIEAALVLAHPTAVEGGRVVDDLVSNVDVFATLLDVADAPIPDVETGGKPIAGQSVAPLLLEGRDADGYEPRDRLFAGMTWHDRYNPIRAIRTERWKYVRNFWPLPEVYLTTDIYCSDAGREVREDFYGKQRPYEELFDLENDPLEVDNLAVAARNADASMETAPDDPDLEAVRDRLREELLAWMRETDDPLLEGPVRPSDWERIQPRSDDDR